MTTLPDSRRTVLRLGIGGVAAACGVSGRAAASSWLPYDPAEVKMLLPRASDAFMREVTDFLPVSRYMRIGPAPLPAARRPPDAPRSTPGKQPPTAYVLTAERSGVPAWLLFGVALQESQLAFGRETIAYPWTLCVRGRGERYASYAETLEGLKRYVRAGITNVDCGAMQVNWHWHKDKLRSFELALDPYRNLAVGAGILRGHYATTGNWFSALGLYHTGSVGEPTQRERARRYATGVFARLRRLGVELQPTLATLRADLDDHA